MPRSLSRSSSPGPVPVGVMSTPRTRCSAKTSRLRSSLSRSPEELPRITAYPRSLATSSTPAATSVKKGLPMSMTDRPTVRLCPARRLEAEPWRTNPSSRMAPSTRARVDPATFSGRLSTLDTVPGRPRHAPRRP